jgi:hypothetical protein
MSRTLDIAIIDVNLNSTLGLVNDHGEALYIIIASRKQSPTRRPIAGRLSVSGHHAAGPRPSKRMGSELS